MKLFDNLEREWAKRKYLVSDDTVDEFLAEMKKVKAMSDEEREEYFVDYEGDEGYSYYEYDDTPPGCKACGGPYPQCTTSCKLFDD